MPVPRGGTASNNACKFTLAVLFVLDVRTQPVMALSQRFDSAVSSSYVEAIDRGEWFDPLRIGLDAYVNATS